MFAPCRYCKMPNDACTRERSFGEKCCGSCYHGEKHETIVLACACPDVDDPIECYALRFDVALSRVKSNGDRCDCDCHEKNDE